jgi:hypothetical protein
MGKVLILMGLVIIVLGLVIMSIENGTLTIKWLNWFGNLPGDIKIEKENFKFYFPLTSMIIISVVLSLILRILKKIF